MTIDTSRPTATSSSSRRRARWKGSRGRWASLLVAFGALGALASCKRSTADEPHNEPPPPEKPSARPAASSAAPRVMAIEAERAAPKPSPAPQVQERAALIEVPAGTLETAGKVVAVVAFAIDRTEVTVRAYERCVSAKKCTPAATDDSACNWSSRKTKGDHPINCVTVKQARQYCEQNGQRLPSAAEWQLAAGGAEKRRYPWGEEHPSNIAVAPPVNGKFTPGPARHNLCWVGDDTEKAKYPTGTCPVGSFPSGNTPSGIADLAGNVAEWTSTSIKQPHGTVENVVKGGGYPFDKLGRLEVAVDDSAAFDDEHQAADLGFRCITAKTAAR